jgi:hypothetical protein
MSEHRARPDAAEEALARLLADPAVWVDAPPSLEAEVVDVIRARAGANQRAPSRPARRRRAYGIATAAAAAIVVAVTLSATVAARVEGPRRDFAAQLTGTERAPNARASAAITKNRGGFTVVLDARGITHLPPGEFYQAWLSNEAGTLVPIGTFSSDDSRITLWSGVSPTDFPTMSITIERSDGNQSSSGLRVLAGPVIEH